MKYEVLADAVGVYLACQPDGGMLDSEAAALDLVAACGENGARRVLVRQGNLTEAFFQLKTGLAGAVLQKLVNYRVQAAFVLQPERIRDGRFGEMALEANRARQFHFVETEEEAKAWLALNGG